MRFDILKTCQCAETRCELQYSQIKEGKLARVAAVFVDKSAGQIAPKYRAEVLVRDLESKSVLLFLARHDERFPTYALDNRIQAKLIKQQLGQCVLQYRLSQFNVLP